MQNVDSKWKREGNWKARYSRLYSSRGLVVHPQNVQPERISFMNNDDSPYASLLRMMRSDPHHADSEMNSTCAGPHPMLSLMSQRSDIYGSCMSALVPSEDLGGNETLLLNMVRAQKNAINEEAQDKSLDLPKDDSASEFSEPCVHGLSMRYTERSISRSRFSRVSTKRDMDIPSILAFTPSVPAPPAPLGIPGLQKVVQQKEELPRWSIRRAVCPVCSQKWRDRSHIKIIKNSGLKKNSTYELPSVIAPGRLRSSITMGYEPRPAVAALDREAGLYRGGLRNTSTTWQLTRARRFRAPKPLMPPPEATAPPISSAPLARKDLDQRVSRFLSTESLRI